MMYERLINDSPTDFLSIFFLFVVNWLVWLQHILDIIDSINERCSGSALISSV